MLPALLLTAACAAEAVPPPPPLRTSAPAAVEGARSGPVSIGNGGKPAAGATTAAKASDETAGDLILLINDQRVAGRLEPDKDQPGRIAINTGSGIMLIRRELVKSTELGLASRLASVKGDDLKALIELALWCRAKGYNQKALEILAKAVALPDCDLVTRGWYARLVDELQGPETAFPLYVAYRAAGGTDPSILDRLRQLESIKADYEARLKALGLDASVGTPAVAATGAAGGTATSIAEGLEVRGWASENPKWANPATIEVATITTPEGPRRVLRVDYGPCTDPELKPPPDKAAVRKAMNLSVTDDAAVLSFQASHRNAAPLKVAIAIKTGNWEYFESQPVAVQPAGADGGFTKIAFDLRKSTFKCRANNWTYGSPIANLNDVKEVQILVFNGRSSGSLLISTIAFVRDAEM